MSFSDYLHEKAEESRHNETLAYLMFLAGSVFFVGGILSTLSLHQEPMWFLIFPYYADMDAGTFLGLTLLISGILLIVFGLVASIGYSNDRSWYMKELHKANSAEEVLMYRETPKNRHKKKNAK